MINKKAVLIALLVSFAAAWIAYAVLKGGISMPFLRAKPSEGREILVAATDILQRQALSEVMFVRQMVPLTLYNQNMVSQFDPKTAYYAASPIARGEILYADKLGLVDQEPELSYMVDWTQGCVSINVNAASGVSGLIKPGDYVDVYATFTFPKDEVEAKPVSERVYNMTKRILAGLRVVATDIEALQPVIGGPTINRVRTPGDVKRVTLAASTSDIEKLILAYNKAEIHLALISDAIIKKNEKMKYDTGHIKIECVRGEQSEEVYVER